jgi:hydrogenase-4 component B
VLNHAFFKCLLFYAAGAVYRATHTVDLERLGGLAKRMPRTAAFFLVGAVAISALPPLNGFVSEFIIYSGLLSGEAPAGFERVALVAVAALLSFVGATSALAMVRAFGLAFLGSPRAADVHAEGDAPPSMAGPMWLHLAGTVALGVFPATGLWLVSPVARLFAQAPVAVGGGPSVLPLLAPLRVGNALLLGAVAVLLAATWGVRRASRRHVTWGCGYAAPTPRMQYTGTSFSAQFVLVFESFVLELRREKPPDGYFPEGDGHVHTHHADAVERRMFESLGNGETLVRNVTDRIPEGPRSSFAAGLITLVVLIALLSSHTGGAP